MTPDFPRPRLGVSACVLGQPVRWDGGHKRDRFTAEVLAEYVDFVPLCPEAAIGMGIPRPPIRLVGELEAPRARGVKDAALEVTAQLRAYGAAQAAAHTDLCGYVFKKDSPSCGAFKVRVYGEDGQVRGHGRGLYAAAFLEAQPWLPAEEDGRLNDAVLRENFMARVFTLARWRRDVQPAPSARALVDFHTRHKFMILAHGQTLYRELGRIVARAGGVAGPAQAAAEYLPLLMQSLARPAKRQQHTNVLHHLMGFLKRGMSTADKAELLRLIDRHRRGLVPLIAPLVLLRHHLLRDGNSYLLRQHYLMPYPEDLMLRNHI